MKITREMIQEKVVFHCNTEEKAIEFCEKLDDLGYTWSSCSSYLNYNCYSMHKEDTCYEPYNGIYSDISSCKNKNYKIIEYELDKDVKFA